MILDPLAIEKESFRLIDEAFAREGLSFPEETLPLVKRVVHATGDFAIARDLVFHPQAVKAGVSALKAGANVFCDVKMVAAGIRQSLLARLGGKVFCFIGEEEVGLVARRKGLTRLSWPWKRPSRFLVPKFAWWETPPRPSSLYLRLWRGQTPRPWSSGCRWGWWGPRKSKKSWPEKEAPLSPCGVPGEALRSPPPW